MSVSAEIPSHAEPMRAPRDWPGAEPPEDRWLRAVPLTTEPAPASDPGRGDDAPSRGGAPRLAVVGASQTPAGVRQRDRGRSDQRQRRAQEAIEAQRVEARRAARPHLPSPAEVARDIALALFEVEAGRRSAAQLERVCSPELWCTLEHQVRRHGGLVPRMSDLLRVHFQELMPGLASTVALVRRGSRVQPVAMRLDACSGRWLVTELRY
jgi:Family of unknown function (DUF6459)